MLFSHAFLTKKYTARKELPIITNRAAMNHNANLSLTLVRIILYSPSMKPTPRIVLSNFLSKGSSIFFLSLAM